MFKVSQFIKQVFKIYFNLKVKNTLNVILFLKYQHSFLVMLQSYILFSCTKTVAEGYFEGRNNNNYFS